MTLDRPDLTGVSPEILAYIEALEAEVARAAQITRAPRESSLEEVPLEPDEPPTTVNLVTLSASGIAKRTPRHLYSRQRRGGMGVFGLDTPEEAPPALLALADEQDVVLLFTDHGRSYRMPVSKIPETLVHGRGVPIANLAPLRPGERVIAILPTEGGAHVVLLGERGWVELVRASFLGRTMIPGVAYYDAEERGALVSACWIRDDDDVFIATRQGLAIRFPVQRIPKTGCLGIRLERDDRVVGITATREAGGVFLLSADGKGAIRLMEGFRANKSPGGGGKVALKTEQLTAVQAVEEADDVFVISRYSKVIRFPAAEVPPKTGTFQGVNCMAAVRGDEAVTATVAHL